MISNADAGAAAFFQTKLHLRCESLHFSVPDTVTIGLNTSLESLHPLEENLRQTPLFEGPQNALDRK
jgi:hypothetical protein